MANNLLKKSYQHKDLKEIPFNHLWNTKGVFTTIRLTGSTANFIHLKEHLRNLNNSYSLVKELILYSKGNWQHFLLQHETLFPQDDL